MATAEMKKGDVKDISLAEAGKLKIEWAEREMPVLRLIRERFQKEKPLEGVPLRRASARDRTLRRCWAAKRSGIRFAITRAS